LSLQRGDLRPLVTTTMPPLKAPRLIDQVRERIRYLRYARGTGTGPRGVAQTNALASESKPTLSSDDRQPEARDLLDGLLRRAAGE